MPKFNFNKVAKQFPVFANLLALTENFNFCAELLKFMKTYDFTDKGSYS